MRQEGEGTPERRKGRRWGHLMFLGNQCLWHKIKTLMNENVQWDNCVCPQGFWRGIGNRSPLHGVLVALLRILPNLEFQSWWSDVNWLSSPSPLIIGSCCLTCWPIRTADWHPEVDPQHCHWSSHGFRQVGSALNFNTEMAYNTCGCNSWPTVDESYPEANLLGHRPETTFCHRI